ncbi:MAG TPA: hydantoinase/oxoprolinase family protein [Candidatus Limnocylindria bacterium]|nr:hydantoinase/oxoprolinase family protein [Candidatus Limnocylindria bacterium]
MAQAPDWLIGIDVGGTFTDGALVRPGAEPIAIKSLTNYADPSSGLHAALDRLAAAAGVGRRELLGRTAKFAYGTTLATNLVVEGRGAKVGFITTRGFRDTLVMAGIGRERIGMDLTASRAPSLVPRRLIREVRERIDVNGRVVAPLRSEDVQEAIAAFAVEGVEAIGVCLLWSFRNPAHEEQVAAMLRAHDDWFVTASHEVVPLLGEYERSATTALNAILGPPVHNHLMAVERGLRDDGLTVPLLVMQSSGGLLPVADAARTPVALLGSGPAGGVLASKLLADAMGLRNALCVDMGGTTFDVSLITDGDYALRDRVRYAGQELYTQAIDIDSIGAGGGSIGWVDHGTRLKVGPASARSDPGPASYGRGGTDAAVTDADLVLGRINPEGLAGGSVSIDGAAAERALTALGSPIGLDARGTAEGMIAIVDAAMADAMRAQTVRRGLDPADYTLLVYGGAGPLHAVALARELGIARIVVPALATVFSAYGVVASDLLHVLATTEARPLDDPAPIAATYARLEAEGRRLLAADGVAAERQILRRSAQVRFRGQLHAVDVAVAAGMVDAAFVQQVARDFVREYERLFGAGTASPQAGIEAITLRVDAVGPTVRPPLVAAEVRRRPARPSGSRSVWHEGRAYDAQRFVGPFGAGDEFAGSAIIDYPGHTVWVPPATVAHIDGWQNLVVELI